MSPMNLLTHLDQFIETPNGIFRIRKFIIELAILGKLVSEVSNEKFFFDIKERIQIEKQKLLNEGRIKISKPLPPIEEDEIPIQNADKTVFVRLADIALIEKGATGIQKATPGKYPLIGLSEERSTSDCFQFDAKAAIIPLISSTGHGHASIKRLHYQEGKFALGNILCAVIPYTPDIISARFLYEYFCAYKERLFVSKMIGTANVSLTISKIGEAPVPIISLTAQNQVYELMTLCDELEVAQTKRESRRDRLVATTLHGLNNCDADQEQDAKFSFKDSARFYFNHLPRLTTRPEHIHQLRQMILNLAISGKLVRQNPLDEPASELLVRIKKSKKLLSKGKRSDNSIEQVNSNEQLGIPCGWVKVRFKDILLKLQTGPFGSTLHQHDYEIGGIPVINPASIQNEKIFPIAKMAIGKKTLDRLEVFKLKKGDVIMGRRGEMGRCAVVTERETGWLCGTGCLILRFSEDVSPWFIVKLMGAPIIRKYLGGASVGVTMQNLNQSILKNMQICLPPLAEQHRIVAKVDELTTICAEVEHRLTINAITRQQFFEANLHDALYEI